MSLQENKIDNVARDSSSASDSSGHRFKCSIHYPALRELSSPELQST